MSRSVRIDVRGVPRAQGSIKAFKRKDGGIATTYSDTVWTWRNKVQATVGECMLGAAPLTGAIELWLRFELPRPLAHYGTGKNAEKVKNSAPAWPTHAPDLDKLVRAVCDACTDAGLWKDDAQVVAVHAVKNYGTPPGVNIYLRET